MTVYLVDYPGPVSTSDDRISGGMPSLLRAARETYARAVRRCLADDGFDDVPHNGAFVLTGAPPRTSAFTVRTVLGLTKQGAGQLIDTLVLRGYLERHPHPSDRRRTELTLTDRGRGAAEAIRRGVGGVDHELSHHLPGDQIATSRRALQRIADIGADAAPPATTGGPYLTRITPVFAVTEPTRSMAHYAALGFDVEPYPGGGYGFAQRDGVGIHLNHVPNLDPTTNTSAVYLYVTNADALADQWRRPGIGGQTSLPVTTEYRMREGSHLDPDHNLIRFGTALAYPADTARS